MKALSRGGEASTFGVLRLRASTMPTHFAQDDDICGEASVSDDANRPLLPDAPGSASLCAVRRLFSILLLAVFVMPLLAPLLAFGQVDDSRLPACCRRTGAHHCAMSTAERDQAAGQSASEWRAPASRCPYCPASVVPVHNQQTAAAATHQAFAAALFAHPAGSAQTQARRRIAQDRSAQKRGPPSLVS